LSFQGKLLHVDMGLLISSNFILVYQILINAKFHYC
jgi:hypothetical protein